MNIAFTGALCPTCGMWVVDGQSHSCSIPPTSGCYCGHCGVFITNGSIHECQTKEADIVKRIVLLERRVSEMTALIEFLANAVQEIAKGTQDE